MILHFRARRRCLLVQTDSGYGDPLRLQRRSQRSPWSSKRDVGILGCCRGLLSKSFALPFALRLITSANHLHQFPSRRGILYSVK